MRVTVDGQKQRPLRANFRPIRGVGRSEGGAVLALAVDAHPDGDLLALQFEARTEDGPTRRSGVWSASTGAVEWDPGDGVALRFCDDGKALTVVVLRERAEPGDGRRRRGSEMMIADDGAAAPPLGFRIEQLTFPERALVGACALELAPGRRPRGLVIAPGGQLAAVQWAEGERLGYELVRLGRRARQLPGGGHHLEVDADGEARAGFTPDGRFLVTCVGPLPGWWLPKDGDGDLDAPSDGGTKRVGTVVVHDVESGAVRERPLEDKLKKGWRPKDPDDHRLNAVWGPSWVGQGSFEVVLPTGATRRLRLAT